MHRSTLQTLAMVQMFLLSILDTSDEDATKSSQPDILAARQALLGARAHQRTSAAPSVAGTPPPPLTMTTPLPLATPPVHTREHPPPNDEARDALVKDHFNNLFTEIASILDIVQQKMTAPSTFHVHDDWVVNLLRTSLTGNVLLTALTSVPLVVSLSTAPWMLDALTSLMRTVGKMMPQVLEGKQGRGGAGVAGGDAARVMVSAATPSHPLEDLHAAVRRHLSWLASYMVTCAPARRTEAAQRRAPTPPADDLPSAQVPSAISLLCSHRLCSAGLTTLLDQTPRGHACADLIAHSSAWMSRMRPPQAIDKVGTPEVNRAWVHLVAAALHLSTEPIAQGGDDLHRRLDTAAAVAVKCRPLKQKLLEWRSNRPSTTASNEKSIAQLQVVCEVCLVLLHLRCEHDRALGIDAAMRYAVSVAGIGTSRDGGAEAKPRRLWRNALRHVRSACRFQRIAAFTSSALSMESIVLVLGDTLIPRSQTHEGTAADAPLNDNSSSSTVDSAAALQRAFAQINHDANVRCTGLRHLVDEASLTDCGGSNDNTSHQCTALADPRAAALERLQMFSNSLSQSMQGAHYLTDVSGCAVESSVHIRTMMHRLIDMGLHAMAPCSGGGGHSARGTAAADTQLSAAICVSRLLLNHRWSPEDFIFFTASDTIGTVFRLCCSIFAQSSEATPRVEPPTERTHRVSVRERQKLRSSSVAHAAGGIAINSSGPSPTSTTQPLGQTTSPLVEESLKPMPMTLLEEAQALSWTAVKELLLQCVEHMQQVPDAAAACTAIAASSLVHRRGCEAFLTAVFATLTCELQRCAIYMSHFYYPAQERVSDHVTSLCSLIATTARALIGDGAQSPCTSSLTSHTMRSLSKPAALLLLLGHTSSYGASVPPIVAEHAVRTAGLVFECAHPGIADEALKGAVEDMLSAAATADALTSARVIASRESPCVHLLHLIAQSTRSASESTASSTSSSSTTTHQPFLSRLCVSAIKVLSRLAAKTVWTASIRSLIARGLRQLSAALSPDTPTDQRREASISTLLTTFAACGLDADTPQLGSEVRYCIDGELRLSELGFVVDLNLAAQTALVVPANVYDYTNCETEVPLDALRCAKGDMHLPCFPEVNGAGQFPTAPSPFSVGRLPTIPLLLELLRPSIAMVVDHAHVVQSNAIISAALATWLRVLSTILLHDPLVCNMLSHDGTLHRLYDAYGQRPIASPLPLPYLREASAIALSLHLRSASGLRGAHASFSRFDTAAGNGEGATDLNAFRFSSPAMAAAAVVGGASSSSSPLFAASMLHSSDAALVAGLAPAPLRSSGWLPSALLLRHPSAGLKCVGRALPALQTGVTLELSFFVHDFFSQAQLGESFAVPTAWSKPSVRCRLFGLVDAEGSVVMGIDMVDDRLVLGFPLAAASDTTRNASSVGGTVYDEDEDDEEYNDDEDDDEDDDQLIRHAESAPPISTSRRARRRSASRVPSAIPLMPIPRTECLERWTRLAVILHHNEVLVYRDGELGAIQTYDQAWTGIRPMHALHVGQWVGSDSSESSSQQYHAPVSIRNLRVWPLPVPKHALRNLHEHSDSATHHGLVPDMSFSLSDGTGPVALSDDGQTTAHLLGDIHWGPQLPFASSTTTMTLELDIEQARVQQQQPDAATAAASASQVPGCAPDGYTAVLPSAEERRFHWSSLPPTSDPDEGAVEFTIPRKEIYAHYAALDPQHLNIVVTNMFGSLVGHYVRRGMLHALETLMSARAQVALVNRTMVDIRSVLRVHDVVSAVANLVRYSATANLPQRNVMTATRFLEAHLMSQLKSVEGDDELTHNTLHRFLDDAMHQLNNEHERFDVEIFYTSIGASIECQALPLSILNGGSGTLSFECPRSMEYLFLFGDKQQKSSLAKFPDAQGSWPDVDITVSGPTSWCFAKPSAALKAAPARFRLKVPSHRPVVGHYAVQLLCEVLASRPDKEAEVVLDQRLLAVHASAVRSTRGERRLGHMATMTKLILLWAQRPLVHPNDRTPLILLLDRINTFFFHTERRNALYPASVFMLPGVAVYPPVIRRAAELLTAAIQLETAWTNAPPLLNVHAAEITTCCRSFTKSWQRLCTLQQDAMEVVGGRETSSSDNHCAAGCMVTLCKPPSSSVSASTSSSVSWRRRCRGVWFASCDRGWQTVMSSIGFTRGRWYFEVRVPTNGSPIAAGIITKQFKGLMEVSSSSLGHCGHSWGFDGSRLCRWHNGIRNEFSNRTKWKSRDVVGILLDLEGGVLSCTHNGKAVGVPYENLLTAMAAHNKASTGTLPTAFFPAVSFTTSGCDINFGASPFIFDLPAGFLPVDVSQFRARSGMSIVSALVLVDLSHRLQQNREASDVSQNNNEAEPPAALARAMTAAVARRRLSCPREVERAGPSDVVFFQADRKQRSFDTEIRTGETGCIVQASAVVLGTGKWYYEIAIHGDGQVHLGWAALPFAQRTIGDDAHSWGIDGCHMVARHNRQQRSLGRHPWRDGDIIGCFLDADEGHVGFTINGQPLRDLHDSTGNGTLFHIKDAASMSFAPVVQLEPNATVHVLTNASDQNFIPRGFCALGDGDAVFSAVVEYLTSSAPVPPVGGDSATATSSIHKESSLSSGRRSWLVRPIHLRLFVEAIGRIHDLNAFANQAWSTQEAVRCHLPAIKDYVASEARSNFDDSDVENCLRWVSLTEGLLHDVARFIAPWEGGTSYPTQDAASYSLNAAARFLLRTAVSPVLGLRQMHLLLTSTNRVVGEHVKLTLNRRKAMAMLNHTTSLVDRHRYSMFGQINSLVGKKPSSMFLTGKRLWSVVFAGEGADDVGGPYREALSELCSEVMSAGGLSLFTPSSNQAQSVGPVQDRFTVHPNPPSPVSSACYVFLGRIMGGSLRSGELLPLYLPPPFWMLLLGNTTLGANELGHVDMAMLQSLTALAEELCVHERQGDDDDQAAYEERFTTYNVSGRSIPLFHNSERIPVTRANIDAYTSLVSYFRLMCEGRCAWDAIIQGFSQVVPATAISALKWFEVEQLVCGQSDFDVERLLSTARFEGITATDRRIEFLRNVLVSMTKRDRALFMRFVSGRERLPSGMRLKIMSSAKSGNNEDYDDDHLPHASTCFFWLSIPNYSTQEVLREKLLFAIHQCFDIDADFRVRGDQEDEDLPPTAAVRDQEDEDEFEDYRHLL